MSTRQVVLNVSVVVSASVSLAFLPWHHERNALAAIFGLISGIADLLFRDAKMAVGFLKGGLFTFLIAVPLKPAMVDHTTWYALQPLITYAAAAAVVFFIYSATRRVYARMQGSA